MAVRKPSTERQRRLGSELRRMREHIGMSINEAAVVHRTDRTTVSNTESARSGVSSDRDPPDVTLDDGRHRRRAAG